jgi:hypothetical protein
MIRPVYVHRGELHPFESFVAALPARRKVESGSGGVDLRDGHRRARGRRVAKGDLVGDVEMIRWPERVGVVAGRESDL